MYSEGLPTELFIAATCSSCKGTTSTYAEIPGTQEVKEVDKH